MRVDSTQGRCRACGGTLTIIDADDASMTVECEVCGDSQVVQPDAFGDGCLIQYLGIMEELREGRAP